MVENMRGEQLVDFELKLDEETLDGLRDVVRRRKIPIHDAARRCLAAGMMIKAANYAGADVFGHFPNGEEVEIAKASDRDKL